MQGNLDERDPVVPWCKMQMQSEQACLAFALVAVWDQNKEAMHVRPCGVPTDHT